MTPDRLDEIDIAIAMFKQTHPGSFGGMISELRAHVDELRRELDAAYHRLLNPCNGDDCEGDGSAHCHACPEATLNKALAERDAARAQVADYENRITWHTTCGQCATVLDRAIAETERAEKAEAERDQARSALLAALNRWRPMWRAAVQRTAWYIGLPTKPLPDWLTENGETK